MLSSARLRHNSTSSPVKTRIAKEIHPQLEGRREVMGQDVQAARHAFATAPEGKLYGMEVQDPLDGVGREGPGSPGAHQGGEGTGGRVVASVETSVSPFEAHEDIHDGKRAVLQEEDGNAHGKLAALGPRRIEAQRRKLERQRRFPAHGRRVPLAPHLRGWMEEGGHQRAEEEESLPGEDAPHFPFPPRLTSVTTVRFSRSK